MKEEKLVCLKHINYLINKIIEYIPFLNNHSRSTIITTTIPVLGKRSTSSFQLNSWKLDCPNNYRQSGRNNTRFNSTNTIY